MTRTKERAAPKPSPTAVIDSCNFTITSAANEHTRAAVEALARAAQSNADAIAEIARALKGGNANLGPSIHISN